MSYVKPAVLVYQELQQAPSEVIDPLRAVIVGPNSQLHRFSSATEKALVSLGAYDRLVDHSYPWPGRTAGSLVDLDSTRLFIEDALLLYFEDLMGTQSGGRGVVYADSAYRNRVKSTTVSFRANGASNARSSLLKDRDVAIGDVVYIRGLTNVEDACNEHELWTEVTGFVADNAARTTSAVTYGTGNAATSVYDIDVSQTAGPTNCVFASVDGASTYAGLSSGIMTETYTISVVKSGVSGCTAARLRIVSGSGTDNVEELDPGEIGDTVTIGTRGVKLVFAAASGGCVTTANNAGIPSNQFVIGQTWTVSVTGNYERPCATAGEDYSGNFSDVYIVEVTKGGLWADLPEITVTTARGLDSSGPIVITDDNTEFPIGSNGLTISFVDCDELPDGVDFPDAGNSLGMGDGIVAGLRKGDKFYITVTGGEAGPIRTLILRDDLPIELIDAEDLDIRLFIKKTIEVTGPRLSAPPLKNFTSDATQINVEAGITAYDPTWTSGGVEQPMLVYSAVDSHGEVFGTMYAEYREWLTSETTDLSFINAVSDLDQIPGPLDELNALKWGVYRALQNSNGTRVGYIAVANPLDVDSWVAALERLKGRADVYNIVPLTHMREVLNLVQAHVDGESAPESGNESGAVINLQAVTSKMIVGKSAADVQALAPTSVDGNVVLATLADNPNASGTQYTLLRVVANNSGFITYGVRPGDIVRFLFTIDAFGASSYREFVVDRVLSQGSLVLLNGYTDPIGVAQKMEIWRNLTKNEIVEDLIGQAQSFADRRIVATWPDIVGTGGNSQDGMFLACAVAGRMSGVVPHQGLTNVEITGFDDLASRTIDFFTSAQLDQLSAGGVWVCTETPSGTPYTRHAVTTDTLDLKHREEMARRNVDSISRFFRNTLQKYIGRTNVTPAMIGALRYDLMQQIKYLKRANYTNNLGPQLIDAVIATDANGVELLRQHPLAADRVEIVLNLTVPMAANNIELHLVV